LKVKGERGNVWVKHTPICVVEEKKIPTPARKVVILPSKGKNKQQGRKKMKMTGTWKGGSLYGQ